MSQSNRSSVEIGSVYNLVESDGPRDSQASRGHCSLPMMDGGRRDECCRMHTHDKTRALAWWKMLPTSSLVMSGGRPPMNSRAALMPSVLL
eukprot:20151-Eustigmatos_ZCMA.PRE.1